MKFHYVGALGGAKAINKNKSCIEIAGGFRSCVEPTKINKNKSCIEIIVSVFLQFGVDPINKNKSCIEIKVDCEYRRNSPG